MRLDHHQRLLAEAVRKEREKTKAMIDAMTRLGTTARLLEAAIRLIVKQNLVSEFAQEVSLMEPTAVREGE